MVDGSVCPTTIDKINLKWNSILEERMIETCMVLVDDMAQHMELNSWAKKFRFSRTIKFRTCHENWDQIPEKLSVPTPSGRQKTWCQETLCRLSQGTGRYLASWPCLCSAVLRHPPPPCLSTALHRHDQLDKYHPVPRLRWPNVSWHQIVHLREPIASLIITSSVNLLGICREPVENLSGTCPRCQQLKN